MSGNKGLIAFIFSLYMKKINYMKTIETIKQMITDGQISQEVAEKYFPELRESEDERIRKELVDFIYDKTDTYELREKSNSWLAWIEKQSKPTYNKGLSELLHKVICRYINDPNISYSEREIVSIKVLPYVELLEKQGKQEALCDKCRKEHPSHSCQDITELGRCAVEHEQESTGKVKPKFNIGDTIVEKDLDECGYGTIKDIKDGQYIFTDGSAMNINEQGGWQLVKTSTKH